MHIGNFSLRLTSNISCHGKGGTRLLPETFFAEFFHDGSGPVKHQFVGRPHAVPSSHIRINARPSSKRIYGNFIQPDEGPEGVPGPFLAPSTFCGSLIKVTVGKRFIEPAQISMKSSLEGHEEKYLTPECQLFFQGNTPYDRLWNGYKCFFVKLMAHWLS